jgi:tetratricopeptide (TPR) repeat protein
MKTITLVPLLLAFAACESSGITAEQKVQLVESYQETAQQYYSMGDLDRANAQCLRGLAIEPDNERLRLIQAWTLQRRGTKDDIAQAEALFRDLQAGGDFRAILGLGEALERKGLLFHESAENLKSGKRVTEAADPQKRIADLETQAKKAWDESYEQYTRALALQKEDGVCFSGLARIEVLRGHTDNAYGWAMKLVEVTSTNRAFWHDRLQRADISTSDETRIKETVRQLTRMETAAHMTAGDLALALDKLEDALKQFDDALALDAGSADAYSRRAQVHQALGHYAAAIQDVEKYVALSDRDPNHPDIERAFRLRKECQEALATRH